MSWDDVRYLEALERLGSLGRVARELRVSVSTVYRRIAIVERAVGARCVMQGTAELTPAGKHLASVGKQMATAMAAVEQTVRHARETVDGAVSLTTVEGFVPLLAEPLATLSARHPNLRVRLVIADQGPSVRKQEVDIALAVIAKPPAGLWGRRLFAIRYGAFGTAQAARAKSPRWLLADRTPEHAEWETRQGAEPILRTNSLLAALALAREGVGLAVLPKRLAALYPDLVEVPRFAPSLEMLDRPAWLLTHPDLRTVGRVRATMDAVIRAFAE